MMIIERSGYPAFFPSTFLDANSLAQKLRNRSDRVSDFVYTRLSESTRELLMESSSDSDQERLKIALAKEFNDLISGQTIYDPERFGQVTLRTETCDLLASAGQTGGLWHLNRLLLEDAYPGELSTFRSSPLHAVEPRTNRFRKFLTACMERFLLDYWRRESAAKRGGKAEKVSLDTGHLDINVSDNNDSQLDVDFAFLINEQVLAELKPPPELEEYIFVDPTEHWRPIANRLGLSEQVLRKRVSRLRRRHWELFSSAVAQISGPQDEGDETRYLYELLIRHWPLKRA